MINTGEVSTSCLPCNRKKHKSTSVTRLLQTTTITSGTRSFITSIPYTLDKCVILGDPKLISGPALTLGFGKTNQLIVFSPTEIVTSFIFEYGLKLFNDQTIEEVVVLGLVFIVTNSLPQVPQIFSPYPVITISKDKTVTIDILQPGYTKLYPIVAVSTDNPEIVATADNRLITLDFSNVTNTSDINGHLFVTSTNVIGTIPITLQFSQNDN